MPTWDEFAWAAFLYGAIGGDPDYQNLMNKTELLRNLRTNPIQLEIEKIKDEIIKGFLNKWKCRVQNNQESAIELRNALEIILPYLRALNPFNINDVDFSAIVNVNNETITVDNAIENCYSTVRNIGFNFGPTAASKLLHILQPKLFVMADYKIFQHYNEQDNRISDSGQGYVAYLELMKQMANEIITHFQEAALDPPRQQNQDPSAYLSDRMEYNNPTNPPKTLAKYLDEYNWVKITNGARVPPNWHP